MKPQQFGLTHYERDENDKNRRARNCIALVFAIMCFAGMIEKFI